MVQYAVLRWAREYPALAAWTDNIRLLETLVDTGVMDSSLGESLVLAYQRFRDTYHHLALQEQPGLVEGGVLDQERRQVEQAWDQFFGA